MKWLEKQTAALQRCTTPANVLFIQMECCNRAYCCCCIVWQQLFACRLRSTAPMQLAGGLVADEWHFALCVSVPSVDFDK